MTRLPNFGNSSDFPHYSTTPSVARGQQALDMMMVAVGKAYESNPKLIFKSFEKGGTFSGLDLSNAEKIEIVKDVCQVHKLSDRCMNKVNTLCVAKFGGSI